ncbi:hypothetical protein MNBD_GAMMA16-2022 [hydrothermal vent metagenome]|uniref:Right handed beta helix domain-containing protein n=1 Tax=hydrothermal vent metagenome TaxID=652676 RepID=A0A3B0Z884_9ZZZZ
MFFLKRMLFYCTLLLTACTPPLDSEIQNSSLNTETRNSDLAVDDSAEPSLIDVNIVASETPPLLKEELPLADEDVAESEMLPLPDPIDSATPDMIMSEPEEETNAGKPSRNSGHSNNQAVNWQALIAKSSGNKYKVSTASEFNAYAAIAQPGDVILINDGVYSWGNLVVSSSGTKENPIIYTALNPGKVTFKNASILFKVTGNWNIIGGFTINDITKHLFRVSGGTDNRLTDNIINRPGNDDYGTGYLEITGNSNHTRFDHNTVIDGKAIIRVNVSNLNSFPQDVRIDNNTFRGAILKDAPGKRVIMAVLQVGQGNYYSGLIKDSKKRAALLKALTELEVRTVFEYNTIENFNGNTQETVSNKSSYNIYRYNKFINSNGGISLRHGDYNQVYGNSWKGGSGPESIFIKGSYNVVANNIIDRPNGRGGISESMWGFRPDNPFKNITPRTGNNIIAHNTIIATRKDKWVFRVGYASGGSKEPIIESIYVNNIIMGEAQQLFDYRPAGCSGCVITNNLYYAKGGNIPGSGYDYDQNPFLGDPRLNDYLPTESSALVIDQASSLVLDSVGVDFLGENRKKREKPDLGAVEL